MPGKMQLWKGTIDVALWAIAQQKPITVQRIRDRWNVSRATAYRWWHPLEEARVRAQNMPLPRQPSYRRPLAMPREIPLR